MKFRVKEFATETQLFENDDTCIYDDIKTLKEINHEEDYVC